MTQYISIGNNPNLLTMSFGENALSYYQYGWTEYFYEGEFKLFSNNDCVSLLTDLHSLQRLEFQDGSMRNFYTVTMSSFCSFVV